MVDLPPTAVARILQRWALVLVMLLVVLVGGALLVELYRAAAYFGDVISLYFSAWILQFLVAPLVDGIEKRGLNRGVAAGVVYLGIVLLVAGLLVWSLPLLVTQLREFANWLVHESQKGIPDLTATVNRFIVDHAPMSMRAGLLDTVKNISHQLQTQSKNLSNNVLQTVQTLGARVVPQTFNLLSSGATILLQLLIVLVLSLFMSLQGRPFVRSVVAYLPRSLDPDIEAVFKTVNHAFGGFIRGQLILSTIYGVLIFAVMRIFALIVPNSGDLAGFAAVSGVLGGLILIIPAIGTTLSMVPPLAIGLLVLQDLPRFLILLVVIWVIQIFIANVAGPRVMSDSVGVNTLLTFGALLVGGKLGGLLGAFFAVPILAVVLTIVERVYLRLPHHALAAAGQAPTQGPAPPIAVTPPPADTQRTQTGGARPARRLGKFGALPHRRHR